MLPCAFMVFAASSLAMVTPSYTRSPGRPAPATDSRKKRLAALAHVSSSGSGLAKQPPARTLAPTRLTPAVALSSAGSAAPARCGLTGEVREADASATGAASHASAEAGRPGCGCASGPRSGGVSNILARLAEFRFCEAQITSQLAVFGMALAEVGSDNVGGRMVAPAVRLQPITS